MHMLRTTGVHAHAQQEQNGNLCLQQAKQIHLTCIQTLETYFISKCQVKYCIALVPLDFN